MSAAVASRGTWRLVEDWAIYRFKDLDAVMSGSRGGGGCPSHVVDDGTKVLSAPMPFLCGIDTRHFADMTIRLGR